MSEADPNLATAKPVGHAGPTGHGRKSDRKAAHKAAISAASAAQAGNLRGLDWLNFFVADVQTGFGPFVAVYLTSQRWTQTDIGLALSVGTITALVSQLPGGALVDWLRSKRTAAALAIAAIGASALLFAIKADKVQVFTAEILHGFASCVLTPAIAAISLALVGRTQLGERLGRNARYGSIGNGIAAAVMGACGTYFSSRAVFFLTAALALPAAWALARIGPARVPRLDAVARQPWRMLGGLLVDRRLLAFGACALLFHLSNAAMLPIAAAQATRAAGDAANLIIAGCIVAPQIVVATISPWIGRSAERHGRRLVLLLGWGALPLRGLLMAAFPNPWALVAIQALAGVSAASFGVMMPLVSADVTRRTGHFNLVMGGLGLAVYVGATLSTTVAGSAADHWGVAAAFLLLAAAGAVGTALVWFTMPETHARHGRRRTPPQRPAATTQSPSPAA